MVLQDIFKVILQTSAMGAVVALMILLVKALFKDKLSPIWHYYIWLVLIIRLLVPYSFSSNYSIFSLPSMLSLSSTLSIPSYEANTDNYTEAIHQTELNSNPNTQNIPVSNKQEGLLQIDNTSKQQENLLEKDDTSKFTKEKISGKSLISHENFYNVLSIIWIAGAVLLSSYISISYYIFSRKIKYSPTCNNEPIINLLTETKSIIGIFRNIRMINSDAVKSPVLMGLIKPKVIIPTETFKILTNNEKKYVLMHELIHLKRNDILLNWVITLAICVHWFNPLLWFSFIRIKRDCELSCDAQALMHMHPSEYEKYGETLIKLIKTITNSRWCPGTTAIINKSEIKGRIIMISKFRRRSFFYSLIAILVTSVVFVFGFTGCEDTGKVESNAQLQENGTIGNVEKEDTIKEWNDDFEKKLIEVVREDAAKQFQEFTVALAKKNHTKKSDGSDIAFVAAYENTTDGTIPGVNYYWVNHKTLQIEPSPAKYYAIPSAEGDKDKFNISRVSLIYLVNSLEKLNITDAQALLKNIRQLPVNDKTFNDVKFECYVFEYNNNYYIYDYINGKLYKKAGKDGALKEIYQFDPTKGSPSIIEKSEDLDGDGNVEKIQLDIIRGVITINNVSIRVDSSDFVTWDIVDIDSSDKFKEIRITNHSGMFDHTFYYFYANGKLSYGGFCTGIPAIDGKGTLKYPPNQYNTAESFMEVELAKNHTLQLIDKDYYLMQPFYRITKEQVPLLKAKHSEEVIATVESGERLTILASDSTMMWHLVEDSKGVKGYIDQRYFNALVDIQLKQQEEEKKANEEKPKNTSLYGNWKAKDYNHTSKNVNTGENVTSVIPFFSVDFFFISESNVVQVKSYYGSDNGTYKIVENSKEKTKEIIITGIDAPVIFGNETTIFREKLKFIYNEEDGTMKGIASIAFHGYPGEAEFTLQYATNK